MRLVENQIYDSWVKFKMKWTKPLLIALDKLGVSAHFVSFLSLLFGILTIPALMTGKFHLISWLIIGHAIADGLDGALARHQGKASDKGKFIDIFVGNLFVSLLVIGLIFSDLIDPTVGALYIYLTLLLEVLMMIYNNSKFYKSEDWLFYAKGGALCHLSKAILNTYLVFWGFFSWPYLQEIVMLGTIYLGILTVIYFFKITMET